MRLRGGRPWEVQGRRGRARGEQGKGTVGLGPGGGQALEGLRWDGEPSGWDIQWQAGGMQWCIDCHGQPSSYSSHSFCLPRHPLTAWIRAATAGARLCRPTHYRARFCAGKRRRQHR